MVEWDSETFHPVVIFPEPPKVLDLSGSQEYGIDGAALMNAYMDEIEKTGHKFPVRYKIGG